MQKVKKAAAQLDSRAAISVLNNLKNNQIVVENYNIFCELYEKAILCKDYSLAPLFSDGSLVVKQKIKEAQRKTRKKSQREQSKQQKFSKAG